MKKFCVGLTMLASAIGLSAAQAADTVKLKISSYLPASHPINAVFLDSWTKEVEQKSGGKVKFEMFTGGSAFGHVAKQMDQARAGVVDISVGLTGVPRGRLPRTLIVDMPFLVKTADAGSKILWDLYKDGDIASEYKGVKVLALFTHNAGLIHTRDKKVTTLEDMKGLRLRMPSQAVGMMLEELGALPIGLPPSQVYENLQKGVIDGNLFPYDGVHGFKLAEVLKYHLDAKAYTTSFFFVMNKRKFDALPDDVKQAIEAASGQTLVNKFGPWWNQWDAAGLKDVQAQGNEITVLSDAERARWQKALAPMVDKYLAAIEKMGVKDARQIYEKAQRLAKKYEQ
jgi:TRAP-type C4-dicarboxylate transport system substrate-binding protein